MSELTHDTADGSPQEKNGKAASNTNNESEEEKNSQNDLINAPKRRVGMLLAYCGKNYYGLQMNRGDTSLPTIEGALFDALVKAKVVPEICREKSQQMKYASSSRTDKGVSTCGLVVSLKLRLNEHTKNLINQHLPPDIRVLEIKRATKSFHGKNNADARTYSYTMPTFAFAQPSESTNEYRISEDKLKHVKSVLHRYKGTHSFHNFTSGKKMGESSAKRYILDFWADTPFIHKDLEFITLKVKGQSFMIHQIRKMVGLLIVMVSGRASEEYFCRAFSEPLEDIPKAPGTGLILEVVHYDSYNRKQGHMYGGMDWSSSAEAALEFMKKYILPVIYNDELETESMKFWLASLENHDFTGIKAKEQWNKQVQEQEEKNKMKASKKDTVSNKTETPVFTETPSTVNQQHEVELDKENEESTPGIGIEDQNSETCSNGDTSDPPSKKVKIEAR